ncbi:Pkinase-fungal domain-containing protein [Mycena indigotica]|uniref:Pkinase-fungal domain-containing protein n=1 Tax=Mycena indigotica TaxID=2126181 RepID=A0A8H6WF34_9AGAR|nr:Pkinase-fungal domain-containing protein [Mycena indigotica]KAF7316349.1 Pkinase-fungal domain-containing protein [Mycena indigotica]
MRLTPLEGVGSYSVTLTNLYPHGYGDDKAPFEDPASEVYTAKFVVVDGEVVGLGFFDVAIGDTTRRMRKGGSVTCTIGFISHLIDLSPLHITQSDCSSPPVTQDDLKSVLEHEIRNHVWEFSPMRFATRVCQRTRKTSADVLEVKQRMEIADDIDRADYYDLAVDEPAFQEVFEKCRKDLDTSTFISRFQAAKGGIEGKQDCTQLVAFLNACVALVKSKCPDLAETSVYSQLEFLVYGRPTQDGIEGEKPLKPDIVGVSSPDSQSSEDWRNKRFYWCPPSATEPLPPNAADIQIGIPLEVQDEWPELLRQAATYGHALFAANPLRVYALVLACNPVEWDLRFLLFHRGGLSCSKPLSLVTQRGQEEMLWIWMALFTCKTLAEETQSHCMQTLRRFCIVLCVVAVVLRTCSNFHTLTAPSPISPPSPQLVVHRLQLRPSPIPNPVQATLEDVIDQPVTAEKKGVKMAGKAKKEDVSIAA